MAKRQHYSTDIISQLQLRHHRALVVLEGDLDWQRRQVTAFTRHYSSPLWLGSQPAIDMPAVTAKKAKSWLGREIDCLIVDANCTFSPDAFGMLSGTVVGGGVAILLVTPVEDQTTIPPSMQWLRHQFKNAHCIYLQQALHLGLDNTTTESQLLSAQLESQLSDLSAVTYSQRQAVSEAEEQIKGQLDPESDLDNNPWGCVTVDQTRAVEAIRKVVLGHRKRPLVLTADRGRGKSSALGLAAASLMREREINIVVTAPSFATVETLFKHARQQLELSREQVTQVSESEWQWQNSSLRFVAPDRLIEQQIGCDLLIVDEAAAIPSPLLLDLLTRYNRIAFASTVHGYEGTGRGFAIKFRHFLDKLMPQWRALHIHQAIRWADHDPLESWVFNSLLLNAEMASLSSAAEGALERSDGTNLASAVSHHLLSKSELLADPIRLTQIFGLLVNAHYQTSPADFFQMLDDNELNVWISCLDKQVVGCCLVSVEGRFSTELAEQVSLGLRRPKGHLLPQSVAAHIGLPCAATQRAGRIQRIAVHPQLWRKQIGQQLLMAITCWARQQGFDYLGTSFGVADELVAFWQYAGFDFIRLGITKDAASGCYSALAVKALSQHSLQWLEQAQVLFRVNFNAQCQEQFSDLDAKTVQTLYRLIAKNCQAQTLAVEPLILKQLATYTQGGLGYDMAVGSIEWLVKQWLDLGFVVSHSNEGGGFNETLLINKIIQKHTWPRLIATHHLVGRKQAELALRHHVLLLLNAFHSSDKT
ncbi:tRNA(Met) cytidine acetyltransferase TmcA [Photobacterium kagoshimensis]|uniref:tRNA(Met) cytidine acetyltransferase TmcA n=1 Tax=Photobacterium kagoshimensis TaxID=2910242 RepID=UPI003D0D794F